MKHAYLILAHNEFGLLQTRLDCIDDARNDIYVHIDKKVKTLPALHAEQAGLQLLDQRIDIHWGGFSMVEAEFAEEDHDDPAWHRYSTDHTQYYRQVLVPCNRTLQDDRKSTLFPRQ